MNRKGTRRSEEQRICQEESFLYCVARENKLTFVLQSLRKEQQGKSKLMKKDLLIVPETIKEKPVVPFDYNKKETLCSNLLQTDQIVPILADLSSYCANKVPLLCVPSFFS